MKFKALLLLLSFNSFLSFGQNEEIRISQVSDSIINISGASKLHFVNEIIKAEEIAKADIKDGYPFLNLISGEAPTFNPEQIDFERKYKTYYFEHGCLSPSIEIVEAYNFVILDYLDKKYGNECIRQLRKDVVGLKKWKHKK